MPALLALAFSPARPWQDTDSEAMAMTTFIVVAGVNLVLAIVIAAQAFSFGRGRSDPGSAGGSDLMTLLTLVTVVAGAALAFLRGVPTGAGVPVLFVQVLMSSLLVVVSAAQGHAIRSERRERPPWERSAYGRGIIALYFGMAPALPTMFFLLGSPWQDTGSEAMALTMFIVVSGVNLVLAIVIAAQAFSFGRGRWPGSPAGSDLVTLLTLVTVVAGAALAFLRGVPTGAGAWMLAVQVVMGLLLAMVSAENGRVIRSGRSEQLRRG